MKKNLHTQKSKGQDDHFTLSEMSEKSLEQDPFIAPEFYFDDLPGRVMEKIESEEKGKIVFPAKLFLIRHTWIPLALAASVSLFLFLKQPSLQINKKTDVNSSVTSTQSSEYDPSYAEEVLLIEDNAISEMDESQVDFKSMSQALNLSDTAAITTDEKIQYLINENYDTEIITDL